MADNSSSRQDHTVATLLGLLDLQRSDEEPGGSDDDVFIGSSQFKPDGRVFGGQVLAQSIIAADKTIPDDRFIHSLHGYFLRPGDVTQAIRFGVERLRDGGSFSARRVHAYQHGKTILSMIASFQIPSGGIEHGETLDVASLPRPETLASDDDLIGHVDHPQVQDWLTQRPFDIRHVDEPIFLGAAERKSAHQVVWMRTKSPVDLARNAQSAVLAYASDFSPLEPVLRSEGLSWMTDGLRIASLDHAMWWHHPVKVDEWLAYVSDSPFAGGGRGLGVGKFFNTNGRLVATMAQEGMVRIRR
ncbi:acyl-CoA thioesterase [Spelaeicoccus albus]|uniref:Acyl-CoA thioesterase-2 n=1 Tax=Spelaeicoccus albus TaxID=1280376 RepID=A0A7Z0D4W3_9MICO|nr:acyl-CoA thioesterase II [Spelaeicoccus albus]NYI68937.1 acyl-CoA thioesterase-2 [Spelaeicoccus albus]